MKEKNKIVSWIFVCVWMALIFYLSHQSGEESSELSSGVMQTIVTIITSVLPLKIDLSQFHLYIRKGAHFFAYFMLGILVINALKKNEKIIWKDLVYALMICVIYAISDEIHQVFVPGRSGEVRDVIIDSAGSLSGIMIYFFIFKRIDLS